ncbi:glycosyltransferase family A protein [Parasphingorhabdus sp.]
MNRPKFSVIIPVFNAAATLETTVASVLQQTEKDFELVIVDDGSTDNSLMLSLDMASKDNRIKVKSQPNGGVAAARNFGLSCAHGALVAFLDSDDLWLPTKLERHRTWHRCFPEVAISFAQVEFISNCRDAKRTVSNVPPFKLDVSNLLAENPACTSSNIVVRADCLHQIGLFREHMSYAEDQEWLVRA